MVTMENHIMTFFFEQGDQFPRKVKKRWKKTPENLPQDLKYHHLNSKLSTYLANKDKQAKLQEKLEAELTDASHHSGSVLPDDSKCKQLPTIEISSFHANSQQANKNESLGFSSYEEARRVAHEILSNLCKVLNELAQLHHSLSSFHIILPASLEVTLYGSYQNLIAGVTHVAFREWQTVEAKLAFLNIRNKKINNSNNNSNNTEPHLSSRSDETSGNISSTSVSTRSDEQKSNLGTDSFTDTRRAHLNSLTVLPEIMEEGKSNKSAPVGDLKMKKESKHTFAKSKTRIERYRSGLNPSESRASVRTNPSSTRFAQRRSHGGSRIIEESSVLGENSSESTRSCAGNQSFYQVIQFQLSSKLCDEKGWILHPSATQDPERATLLEWATQRLRLAMEQRKMNDVWDREHKNDGEITIRYYGDNHKNYLSSSNRRKIRVSDLSSTNSHPSVAELFTDVADNRNIFQTTIADGSTTISYFSGRPAIVTSRTLSDSFTRPAFYTLVYSDSDDHALLACFTPSGCGSCYHSNGVVRMWMNEEGGMLSDDTGASVRKWSWSVAEQKLHDTLVIQLNEQITIRCKALNQTHVHFNSKKETVKINVTESASYECNKFSSETLYLQTEFDFTSQCAKDSAKPLKHKPQPKNKPTRSKGKNIQTSQKIISEATPEIEKVLDQLETSTPYTPSDKDRVKLQRKIKNLVEEWLESYRNIVGISAPNRRRTLHSASPFTKAELSVSSPQRRLTSAPTPFPSAFNQEIPVVVIDEKKISDEIENKNVTPSSNQVMFKECEQEKTKSALNQPSSIQGQRATSSYSSFVNLSAPTNFNNIKKYKRTKSAPNRLTSSYTAASLTSPLVSTANINGPQLTASCSSCPVAMRMFLLGEPADKNSFDNVEVSVYNTGSARISVCRCSRYKIPYLTDIEYDSFIEHPVNDRQLMIVCVISSLYVDVTRDALQMLEELHCGHMRNRTRPCPQSRSDAFRIFLYDLATAAEHTAKVDGSPYWHPLLLRRHNVAAGMILMYQGGKLLFCDHIFNGYGNARKDFHKQIKLTRQAANVGQSLPRDFRFSPTKGAQGPRSAWGGQIGGAGVDRHGSPGIQKQLDATKMPSLTSVSSDTSSFTDLNIYNSPDKISKRHAENFFSYFNHSRIPDEPDRKMINTSFSPCSPKILST